MTSPRCSRAVIHGNSPTSIHSSTAQEWVVAAVPGELDQAAAIHPEEIDDLVKPALDRSNRNRAADRWLNAVAREDRSFSKRSALGERELHPPAVQDAREGLAEQAKPLHQVVRPGVAVTNGAEGEHAEDGTPGAQGDNTFERVPARSKLARSSAAASGSSASRENRTISPSRSLSAAQGNCRRP